MARDKAQFVLIHGACHGGWCWEETADHLRALDQKVLTPTLPGLGDQAHLLNAETDLDCMANAVAKEIEAAGLVDTVLVGHSFGGAIITILADRMASRLRQLIYLDALWLESGTSIFDTMDPEIVTARRAQVEAEGDGIALPAPPPQAFGVTDPVKAAWVREKLTPHPIASYERPVTLSNPVLNGLAAEYIVCVDPFYAPLARARARVRELGLPMHELHAPHDAMVTHPVETAQMLLALAGKQTGKQR